MKKLFIISSILLVIFLFFLGIYNFSFKKKSPIVEKKVSGSENEEKENKLFNLGSNKGEIFLISEGPILSPMVNKTGETAAYYIKTSGNIQGFNFDEKDRKEEVFIENNLIGLVDVIWSPTKTKAILEFETDGEINFKFIDYSSNEPKDLKKGVDSISWNSFGDKIVYKHFDQKTGKRTLNIADPDGSNWKKLADIEYKEISISPVPGSPLVSFWNSADSFQETSFKTISTIGGGEKEIVSGKFGADYKWSPDGNRVLVSFVGSQGGSDIKMGVLGKDGGDIIDLNAPTFVSKCAWSKDNVNVYCSLPSTSLTENSVLPNDYQSGKATTADTFWKINVSTIEKERVVTLENLKKVGENFDATNLFLSPEEDSLFFVDRSNGKLYGIDLED